MNSSNQSRQCRDKSFVCTYIPRFSWYVGAILITFGALSMPASSFVTGMLVPGTIRYLMLSVPAAVVSLVAFAMFEGRVPKEPCGLELKWISSIIIALGILVIAWGFYRSRTAWGSIGISLIYWGAELRLLPAESDYWEQRRNRRTPDT